MDIEEKVRQFTDYATPYTQEEPLQFGCRLKLRHTMDVLSAARQIMTGEGVADPRRRLTGELAALYHDLSRFEQFRQYHTFVDAISFDHGERSAEMLTAGSWLAGGDAELRREVIAAVRFHNKRRLPETLPEPYRFTAQLVRDADKISIYRMTLEHFRHSERGKRDRSLTLGLPERPFVNHSLIGVIRAAGTLAVKDLTCIDDFLLYLFSWSGDLNFRASRKLIDEEDLFPQLREFLPPDGDLDLLLQELQQKLKAN